MPEVSFWTQATSTALLLLLFAFVLSAVIGVERQRQLKSAGIRTHTVVGLGAALFTLVSSYGFADVIGEDVVLDPSRISAQIVSGIGFLGAGVIFVRQNSVSGLTTAASIWVTAAVGMACGAGLPTLAAAATLLYILAVSALAAFGRRLRGGDLSRAYILRYKESRGVLRQVLVRATELGYEASLLRAHLVEDDAGRVRVEAGVRFRRTHRGPIDDLASILMDIKGVVSVEPAGVDGD